MTNDTTSLAALMLRNMETVFGEADAGRRIQNIAGLYAERSTIFEADKVVRGHAEIAEMVTALRASLPDGARFEPVAPPLAHHDVGRLNWRLVLGGCSCSSTRRPPVLPDPIAGASAWGTSC